MKMDNSTETRKQILPPKQKKETDFLWWKYAVYHYNIV